MDKDTSILKQQALPISLAVVVCFALIGVLWTEIQFLNWAIPDDILTRVRFVDILIGLTIYLKTSIDFAIYIGRLMGTYPGLKGRIAIEIGTAVGNAVGTILILLVWAFFKEVDWLLAIMILVAALVLFKLAEDSLVHAESDDTRYPAWFKRIVIFTQRILSGFNTIAGPVLKRIVPHTSLKQGGSTAFWSVFAMSFTIPLILGLDDFAGYVPLFDIVSVFGFAIGTIVGHTILNILLYISPGRTIRVVKNPIISFIGSLAFVGLGLWGLIEVVRIFVH